ncbi:hypothetical protein [Candidatus Viridilinea mediisalina]|uniref:Uncharacterized protein n=1 Tax=Candidatus Viridilinea mediisalina TaxID=2024553 RepID=A0A2A6RGS5_9CHLR|nr:hypothetical protein [Candidatus Viridilinea mediisalina]PDW02267.1 hypothetical protein CJ255_14835 [Candidatus Viridilinea mediisalina]
MTTTITLPETLARQLAQRAATERLSVETLAIAFLTSALHEERLDESEEERSPLDEDPELLALIASIKAMPPDPAYIIPAKGNLADVLRIMAQGEPDQDLLDALDAAEQELRAIDRANDVAEGRGLL